MNFGMEKCARIFFKKGRVQSKIYIGSTFEKNIKELDPRDAYSCLGTEDSHDRQHKNGKEKLKNNYIALVFSARGFIPDMNKQGLTKLNLPPRPTVPDSKGGHAKHLFYHEKITQ